MPMTAMTLTMIQMARDTLRGNFIGEYERVSVYG